MDQDTSGESNLASWHPALRPDDVQQILTHIERSSSFPSSPLGSGSNNTRPTDDLPETQAGAIVANAEEDVARDPTSQVSSHSDHSTKAISRRSTASEAMFEGQGPSFFDQIPSTDQTSKSPTNAEARFEEGLPLIDSRSAPNDGFQEERGIVQSTEPRMWKSSANEDEAAFFDHANMSSLGDTTTFSPVNLHRKATSDVFESLSFSSHGAPDSLRHDAGQPNSLNSAQEREDDQAREENLHSNGNTDISAAWGAVLDDDDFLADDSDGLLSDSSPQSRPDSPSSFLGSPEQGNNVLEPDEVLSQYEPSSSHGALVSASNDQRPQPASRQTSQLYAPHQPSTSELAQLSPTTYGNVGLSRPNLGPMPFGQNSFQGQLQRPPAPSKAKSFVDQSKGGYKSPYDLPMDLSKPRKRVQMHQPLPAPKAPAPPPRSSSKTSDQQTSSDGLLQSPFSPANSTFESQARPQTSHYPTPMPSVGRRVSHEQANTSKAKASSSSFFEELPLAAKPRPTTAHGRYAPTQTGAPPHIPAASPANQMPPPPLPTKKSSADLYSQYQLQRPERVDPYANVPLQPSDVPAMSNARYSPAPLASQIAPPSSRYSPALPNSQIAPALPPAASRYSPVPPAQPNATQSQNRYVSQPQSSSHPPPYATVSQARIPSQPGPPVANALPFQPRTSSPLAYHGKKSDSQMVGLQETSDLSPVSPPARLIPPTSPPRETPPLSGPPESGQEFAPPRRSQTQSPGRGGLVSFVSTSNDVMQRPASVHGPASPTTSANPSQSFQAARPSVRKRGLSHHPNFITPTDESQHDELQRWRGSPIFRFGVGGFVLSSFPRHVPRYAGGSAVPMVKPMAGEVQLRSAKEIFPIPEHIAKFPGPLRSKSKKKEVLAWLSDRIATLEFMPSPSVSHRIPDPFKRHEEKILLWKVIRVIVEQDGAVDGNVEVQRAMNLILSPESVNPQDRPSTHDTVGSGINGIYKPVGIISNTELVDPATVERVRKSLLHGEREKAVWTAVESRLWAHAMLLSSTLDKSVWKQVVHEFIRQEVKVIGTNTESLAALYEIFAGNLEESVDELVPPSARAGLQMVSKVGVAGPTKSALDGLDRWRETLGLVLNNRSPEDERALAALGRLLASYGRIEASHICHLFANSRTTSSVFGGADDPQASIVLLGADPRTQPNEFYRDEDAILLTEVYEFATSILASSPKWALMAHVQAYKLQRVRSLAEAGFRAEAQAYCEAMGASLRLTTRLSPYYHPQFLTELDELTQRLSHTPPGTSSWISKPTIGKVSDSMWNKFTTFVAGDESDAASTGSGRDGGHEFGPFAKVSGTPSMSRSGSSSDLHGSYSTGGADSAPNTLAGSRYAPGGQYSARSSLELTRGRPSLDSQRSPSYLPQRSMQRSPYHPIASGNQQSFVSPTIPTQSASPYVPFGASPPVQSPQATPPQHSYMPIVPPEGYHASYQPPQPQPDVPTPPPEQPESYMSAPSRPAPSSDLASSMDPPFTDHSLPQPQLQMSCPQTSPGCPAPLQSYGSYEPPSAEYAPYHPEPQSDSDSEKMNSKQKSFTNDDDFSTSAKASQYESLAKADEHAAAEARKKANDEAAEAAFRAAAEADAARDKPSTAQDKVVKSKTSWFGLFSRKESDSLQSSGNKAGSGPGEQKVIRAKLGEESSFYYDKELKKWVNKKDPASMQQSSKATPPPPKGPVGRVVSESLGSAAGGGGGGPARSGLAAPPPSLSSSRPPSSSGPPSRVESPGEGAGNDGGTVLVGRGDTTEPAPPPSTSIGGAGLAPPTAPTTSRPASTASDIDDLLGAVAGRKAGGTVRGKKGRAGAGRYVDIMAK